VVSTSAERTLLKGIGRSKLAANSERLLGVSMTDRNWNTICNIYALAKGEEK